MKPNNFKKLHYCNQVHYFISVSSLFLFLRENGDFEEVIVLPSHSRLSPPEGEEEQQQLEERVPVMAFRENGLLKPLSGIEEISAQQGAGQQTSSFCFALWSFPFVSPLFVRSLLSTLTVITLKLAFCLFRNVD